MSNSRYPIKVPVNTVLLNHYYCIAIDNNKIILGEKFDTNKTITSKWIETSELSKHSLDESSPIEENIQLLFKKNNYKYKIVQDKMNKDAVQIGGLIIPSTLITDAAQYVLKKNNRPI